MYHAGSVHEMNMRKTLKSRGTEKSPRFRVGKDIIDGIVLALGVTIGIF